MLQQSWTNTAPQVRDFCFPCAEILLDVLSLEYRRSDLFEQIHDGSFFADWVKTFIFLPAGIILLVLWLTGIWLFFEPHIKRWQRSRRRAAKR